MRDATRRIVLVAAVLVAGLAGQARASFTVYTDRPSFNAATTGVSTIDFEGIAGGSYTYEGGSFTIGGVNFSDDIARMFVFDKGFNGPGLASDYLNENEFGTHSITINPGAGTTALGTDFGTLNHTFGTSLAITVTAIDGSGTSTYSVTAPIQPDLAFLGFTSDSLIVSITFTGELLVLDNVSTGLRSVPEPASLISCAIGGLTAIGFALRRRKVKVTA